MNSEKYDSGSHQRVPDSALKPSRTALLVIDVQNDFCDEDGYFARSVSEMKKVGLDPHLLSGKVRSIERVLAAARKAGTFVVHTRILRDPDQYHSVRNIHRILPATYQAYTEPGEDPPLAPGTWGAEHVKAVAPAVGEYALTKRAFSAFFQTDLEMVLRRRAIETVVLVGVIGYVCVLHTAFDAHARDFDVIVVQDAIGSWAEGLDEAVGQIVDLILGASVTVEELEERLLTEETG